MKHTYSYKGAVFLNDCMVLNTWTASVIAQNGIEANRLLSQKFKGQYGLKGNHRVRLYGKFKKLEAVMD